jgi:hypothetical protein
LSGFVQIDDVYWSGEQRGGKRGRCSSNKTPFVVAVSLNVDGNPISMHMNVVKGFKSEEISRWASSHLIALSTIISDGLVYFNALKD